MSGELSAVVRVIPYGSRLLLPTNLAISARCDIAEQPVWPRFFADHITFSDRAPMRGSPFRGTPSAFVWSRAGESNRGGEQVADTNWAL